MVIQLILKLVFVKENLALKARSKGNEKQALPWKSTQEETVHFCSVAFITQLQLHLSLTSFLWLLNNYWYILTRLWWEKQRGQCVWCKGVRACEGLQSAGEQSGQAGQALTCPSCASVRCKPDSLHTVKWPMVHRLLALAWLKKPQCLPYPGEKPR